MINPIPFFYYKNDTLYDYILNPVAELLSQPLPWYVAGPLIGMIVPLLLLTGNKELGVSSNLRHICAACLPKGIRYFDYNWKAKGKWNLYFLAGIFIGGFLGGYIFHNPEPIAISATTVQDLSVLGISNFSGYIPAEIFNWSNIWSLQGIVMLMIGGFLIGFGTRYAGGCTSGHTISGVANLQAASIVASAGFFIGGLIITHLFFPFLL